MKNIDTILAETNLFTPLALRCGYTPITHDKEVAA
jgi:hypothetical protein